MKVTCSAAKIRTKFDVLGENHGPEILDLQKKMSNEEEVVLEHTRKVVAITDSCSSNEHPCTQQCADDATKAKCELQQAKKNMHPGFAIVFDNIDGKHECWHMTKDNQNFDFHNVNYNKLRRTCILVLLLCLIILMESASAGICPRTIKTLIFIRSTTR